MEDQGWQVDAQSLTGATRLYEKAGMPVGREVVTWEKELRAGRELGTQTLQLQLGTAGRWR